MQRVRQITLVGTGTAAPVDGHAPACIAVQDTDALILLDIGPGSISRLPGYGLDYREITGVLVSHLHADHVLDIATLLQALIYTPGYTHERSLTFIGPVGFSRFLADLMGLFPDLTPESFPLDVQEIRSGETNVDRWLVLAAPNQHTPTSISFRLAHPELPAALAYSGDAADPLAVGRLARGAHTLIAECSFPAGWHERGQHFSATEAGRAAAMAGVERLVLTHRYPPALDESVRCDAQEEFAGEVVLSRDGMTLELPSAH